MARPIQRKAGLGSSFTLLGLRPNRRGAESGFLIQSAKILFTPQIGVLSFVTPFWAFLVVVGLALFSSERVWAGLSASEVVVVVNGGSLSSRTLANHYAKLREIPAVNIVVLENIPDREQITVQEFREAILIPLFNEIESRRLSAHVQCIAYSADFPTAIDVSQDLAAVKDLHTVFTKVASINGLTYLYDLTLRADPAYISPDINFYARRVMEAYFTNPAGKESAEAWAELGLNGIQKEYAKASEIGDKLVEQYPSQFPLKYLSAAYAAQANQTEKALKRLEEAISAGWTSGGYLAADQRFDSLRESDEFQELELLLEQDQGKWQPTVAFNARSAWSANGIENPWDPKKNDLGLKYMLSTVLGVTRGAGNSLEEAIAALNRASLADCSHPHGAFYFCSTADVRAKTREPNFKLAVDELKKMGFGAEIVYQALPGSKPDVLGAQLGIANFDWKSSGSTILQGAIVENLTSLGGVMTLPNSQTPLTHLVANGAAGSSGAVTEPYAVQFKFPTPHLYVHYAQGLSLAEAFYQSVTGPYQLLIVGDPLCQPFSTAPTKTIDASPRVVERNGAIQFQPNLSGPSFFEWLSKPEPPAHRRVQLRPARVAVQIDGGLMQGGNIQQNVNVKLENLPLGYHEVQVTVVADDPLKQRRMQTIPVWIGERGLLKLSLVGAEPGKAKQKAVTDGWFKVRAVVPADCVELQIVHELEQVGLAESVTTETEISLDPLKLGLGPVRLQAQATQQDGSVIFSQPLWVEIVP